MFPSEEDINELQKRIDPSKQGFFTMNRFVDVGMDFAGRQAKIDHEQELLKAFSFFDEGTPSPTKTRLATSLRPT